MREVIAVGVDTGPDVLHIMDRHFPDGLELVYQPTYGRVLFAKQTPVHITGCLIGRIGPDAGLKFQRTW